jgi:hypothetical protein
MIKLSREIRLAVLEASERTFDRGVARDAFVAVPIKRPERNDLVAQLSRAKP